jgi:hypothetical protein
MLRLQSARGERALDSGQDAVEKPQGTEDLPAQAGSALRYMWRCATGDVAESKWER